MPVTNFRDNAGYASAVGLLMRYHLQGSPHGSAASFENSQFWNNPLGVGLHYAQNSVLRNLDHHSHPRRNSTPMASMRISSKAISSMKTSP